MNYYNIRVNVTGWELSYFRGDVKEKMPR